MLKRCEAVVCVLVACEQGHFCKFRERRREENGPLDVGSAPKIIFPDFRQVTCHWLSEPARRLAYEGIFLKAFCSTSIRGFVLSYSTRKFPLCVSCSAVYYEFYYHNARGILLFLVVSLRPGVSMLRIILRWVSILSMGM